LAWRRRSAARLNLEVLEPRELLAVWTVISNTDTGTGSTTDPSQGDLRYCLTMANSDATAPVINFSIAGDTTIALSGPLPAVAKSMVIDATTQGDFQGVPLVAIDGTQITSGGVGALTIAATGGGSLVAGLAFINSGGVGVSIEGDNSGSGGSTISGCFFGTSDGVTAKPNFVGLRISGSSNNTIGGTAQFTGNLFSGNSTIGIAIGDVGVANNNVVIGNIIGLDATGSSSLGTQLTGIFVDHSVGTRIQSNLISGNGGDGVWIQNASGVPTGVTVVGNGIGVASTLLSAVPNGLNGVHVRGGSGITIGGVGAGDPNVLSGNTANGVLLETGVDASATPTTNVLIQGNRIGTNFTGSAAVPNSNDGILTIAAQGVTIGGTAAEARNLISGNTQAGVELQGVSGTNTSSTLIQGNYIGVNASGTNVLANNIGINQNGGDATTIGGTAPGAGNVISGNRNEGIRLGTGDHSVVQGNIIGADATATAALGNATGILFANASFATIGGSAAGAGNIISGNTGSGIDCFVIGSEGEVIQGNWIGVVPGATPTSPATPLGNGDHGVRIAGPINVLVGGTNPGEGNVIASNGGDGINTFATSDGLTVEGNVIGADRVGTAGLGNGGNGVTLFSNNNTIGGTDLGAGNTIANNGANGIALVLGSNHNSFLGNSIYNNALNQTGSVFLGINFGQSNEPLPNQTWPPGPAGGGPNDFQNYPVLDPSSGIYDGSTIDIQGTLNANVGQTYRVEFFASPTQNASGHGEGRIFLGAIAVPVINTTTYTASFDATLTPPVPIPSGYFLTATATDPLGNTSEFAQNIVSQQIVDVSVSGAVASDFPGDPATVVVGGELTYTLTITNSGVVDAQNVQFVDTLDPNVTYEMSSTDVSGVVTTYDPASNTVTATFPSLAAGQTAHVTILVKVNPSAASGAPTPIANAFQITTPDVNTSPDTSGQVATADVLPAADLLVSDLTATPDGTNTPIYAGNAFTYTITVGNLSGLSDATNVVVTDYLPDSTLVTFDVTLNPGWTLFVSGTSQYATFNLGTLASGASQSVSLVVTPTAAAVASPLSNYATVFSTADATLAAVYDPDLANNTSAPISTTITAFADVQASITPDPDVIFPGDDLSFSIDATNNGPSTATGVGLTVTVPEGTTFVSAVQGGSPIVVTPIGGLLNFDLGDLASGDSIQPIVITVSTAGITSSSPVALTTTANFGWNEAPGSTSLANVVVGTVTPKSAIAVDLQSAPATIYVGETATYTLTVTNNGPSDDTNVTASLAFPADSVVSLLSGNYLLQQTPTGQVAVFNIGSLAAGASVERTIQFLALPPAAGAGSGTVDVTATVAGDNSPDEQAVSSTNVLAAVNLAIQLSAAPSPAQFSQDLVYTVRATNNGPSPATGVVVYNALPAIPQYVNFVSVALNGTIINVTPDAAGLLTLPVGTLNSGQSAVFTITVTTNAAAIAASPIVNVAQVVGNEHDTNPDDDRQTLEVTVTPAVDLTTGLTADPEAVEVGSNTTFTATLMNAGPSDATNVSLIATIPANSTLIATSPGVTVSNGRLIFNVASLPVGAMTGFQFVVSPTSASLTTGTITSTAVAQVAESIINPNTSSASASVTVIDRFGIIQLDASSYSVNEDAGSVAIVVDRVGGARGAVTVDFTTVAVTAVPGFDFTPVSGTLTFDAGVTTQTIVVPILANPYNDGNVTFYVVLSNVSPAAALLGSPSAAQVTVVDLDPNTTPLLVGLPTWQGTATTITSVSLTFNQPLSSATATNPANFLMVGVGPDNRYGTADDYTIGLTPSYDPSTFTVTLTPWAPIGGNTFYHLTVVGTAGGLTNLGGRPLSGDGTTPGTNEVTSLARGTSLKYYTSAGDLVTLGVSGGGFLDDLLDASNSGKQLVLVGQVPKRTTLTGTVTKGLFGTGRAYLGYTIFGLGNFGDVRVKMYSPPFVVDRYPFSPGGPITQVNNGSVVRLDGQVVKAGRSPRGRAAAAPHPRRNATDRAAMPRSFHVLHR